MPEYHNPDPLVRLIGKTNEASAVVDGVPITCLIDSGSCMSAMVKSFAKELNLEIKPLHTILDIEDTGVELVLTMDMLNVVCSYLK